MQFAQRGVRAGQLRIEVHGVKTYVDVSAAATHMLYGVGREVNNDLFNLGSIGKYRR